VANRRPSERRIYKENQCRLIRSNLRAACQSRIEGRRENSKNSGTWNSPSVPQFKVLFFERIYPALVYDAGVFHTLAITFLYLISIFGWGEFVCSRISGRVRDFSDYLASRLVLGCFGLYASFVLLSVAGLLKPFPVALVLACGLIAGIVSLRAAGRRLSEAFRDISNWSSSRQALFATICVLAALQIACGLTPLILYDSQIYQLLAPVQFLQAGTLAHIPWNVLTNAPMASSSPIRRSAWNDRPVGKS